MAVAIFFTFSGMVLIVSWVYLGVTFHHYWKQSKAEAKKDLP